MVKNNPEAKALSVFTSPKSQQFTHQSTAVLVPTGAVEQHGPHLPLGTDIFIAEAIAKKVAGAVDDALVSESISYGCSGHHTGFPGTVSLQTSTFIALLFDVCNSLFRSGFVPVLLNGHHGNGPSLQVPLTNLAENGVRAYALSYFDLLESAVFEILPEPEVSVGHAGALETSLMMYLYPELVVQDEIPADGTPTVWPDPHMYSELTVSVVRPFEEINETGVIGRPKLGSAEHGERLFGRAVSRCAEIVEKILSLHSDKGRR